MVRRRTTYVKYVVYLTSTIASVFHAKATTATIRRQPIVVPGRLARSARRLVIHLPKDWPWQDSWEGLFNTVCGPPTPATT